MQINKNDILFSKFPSRLPESSKDYTNFLSWKLACMKKFSVIKEIPSFILLKDSKYLISCKFDRLIMVNSIWDIENSVGCLFELEFSIDITGFDFRSFSVMSVSDQNDLIFNNSTGSKSFDERAFDMLKTLASSKENQSKSPEELAIKAIKLTLEFDNKISSLKTP